jgi:hypothetical protein
MTQLVSETKHPYNISLMLSRSPISKFIQLNYITNSTAHISDVFYSGQSIWYFSTAHLNVKSNVCFYNGLLNN